MWVVYERMFSPAGRYLCIQVTLSWTQSTPFRLQWNSSDSTLNKAVSDVVESWQGRPCIASRTCPEQLQTKFHLNSGFEVKFVSPYLSRRRSSWPDDAVKIGRTRLFGPEKVLSSEDELLLVLSQPCCRVEGV